LRNGQDWRFAGAETQEEKERGRNKLAPIRERKAPASESRRYKFKGTKLPLQIQKHETPDTKSKARI
jgi:hypothetical protein